MVVEVKILLQVHCQVLVVIFNGLTEVRRPCPFSRTLLRDPSVYSDFNLNSTTGTIIKIKT